MIYEDFAPGMPASDPLYDEAMAALQAGDWGAAITSLEALLQVYPGDPALQKALDDARFKAGFDASHAVRARTNTIQWRPILFRALLLAAAVAAVLLVFRVVQQRLAPVLAAQAMEARNVRLCDQGRSYLEGNRLEEARASFTELQSRAPGSLCAGEGLYEIKRMETLAALCKNAENSFASDSPADWEAARAQFQEIQLSFPERCNARLRITQLNEKLAVRELAGAAAAAYDAGDCTEAARLYEDLKLQSASYERELGDSRLFECYMKLGTEIVNQSPPAPERVAEALGRFSRALALEPNDPEAQGEQKLASLFVAGQDAQIGSRPAEAIIRWESVYAARPNYLGGAVGPLLYTLLLNEGDKYRGSADCAQAYDHYRRALALPVDTAAARERLDSVRNCLTPTPTPTTTPTITPIPTATPYVPPTSPPPATPAPSLATFRGQIVYRGKAVGKEGYWVMRPDGSNKRFLGSSEKLDADFKAQYEKLGYSPDGSRRLYVAKDDQNEQIWYEWNFEGRRYKEQLTDFGRVSYDPVWSPDGGKIAFVSQFHDSDDIWVSDPDGNNMRNLTPNTWEWDKHPTFSPDGRQIAFWSNRDGVRRLYIMDADGRNVRNISGKTDYDEWEPIWIR